MKKIQSDMVMIILIKGLEGVALSRDLTAEVTIKAQIAVVLIKGQTKVIMEKGKTETVFALVQMVVAITKDLIVVDLGLDLTEAVLVKVVLVLIKAQIEDFNKDQVEVP